MSGVRRLPGFVLGIAIAIWVGWVGGALAQSTEPFAEPIRTGTKPAPRAQLVIDPPAECEPTELGRFDLRALRRDLGQRFPWITQSFVKGYPLACRDDSGRIYADLEFEPHLLRPRWELHRELSCVRDGWDPWECEYPQEVTLVRLAANDRGSLVFDAIPVEDALRALAVVQQALRDGVVVDPFADDDADADADDDAADDADDDADEADDGADEADDPDDDLDDGVADAAVPGDDDATPARQTPGADSAAEAELAGVAPAVDGAAGTEAPDAQVVRATAAESVDAKALDARPGDAGPANAQATDAQAANAEAADDQASDREAADAEPTDAEGAQADGVIVEALLSVSREEYCGGLLVTAELEDSEVLLELCVEPQVCADPTLPECAWSVRFQGRSGSV